MKQLAVCSISLCLAVTVRPQNVPTLINYQGQLSDSSGQPLATADYSLGFVIYGQESGGSAVWGPQVFPKVPVVQGYFNVLLGPNDAQTRSLATAFAGADRYIEVSVNGGSAIAPRQRIVSAPFAFRSETAGRADSSVEATKLGGFDWSVVFGTANPSGATIPGSKIQAGTITATHIATNTITASHIANNTITSQQLAPGVIGANQLADGSITLPKLAAVSVGTTVGIGGIAISPTCDLWKNSTATLQPVTNSKGEALSVTLTSAGRPVEIFLMSSGTSNNPDIPGGFLRARNDTGDVVEAGIVVSLLRDGSRLADHYMSGNRDRIVCIPPASVRLIDIAPAGTHTYSVQARGAGSIGSECNFIMVQLVAREL